MLVISALSCIYLIALLKGN